MKGLSDELFVKFQELCDVSHVSPLAAQAIGDLLHEAYYEGYDSGYRDGLAKGDLRCAIKEWKQTIQPQP